MMTRISKYWGSDVSSETSTKPIALDKLGFTASLVNIIIKILNIVITGGFIMTIIIMVSFSYVRICIKIMISNNKDCMTTMWEINEFHRIHRKSSCHVGQPCSTLILVNLFCPVVQLNQDFLVWNEWGTNVSRVGKYM